MQICSDFEGIPLKSVHCLEWKNYWPPQKGRLFDVPLMNLNSTEKLCDEVSMEASNSSKTKIKHDSLMDLIVLFVHPHKYQPINQFRVAFLCVSGLIKIPKKNQPEPEIELFLSNFLFLLKTSLMSFQCSPWGVVLAAKYETSACWGGTCGGDDFFPCNLHPPAKPSAPFLRQ